MQERKRVHAKAEAVGKRGEGRGKGVVNLDEESPVGLRQRKCPFPAWIRKINVFPRERNEPERKESNAGKIYYPASTGNILFPRPQGEEDDSHPLAHLPVVFGAGGGGLGGGLPGLPGPRLGLLVPRRGRVRHRSNSSVGTDFQLNASSGTATTSLPLHLAGHHRGHDGAKRVRLHSDHRQMDTPATSKTRRTWTTS